MSPTSHSFDRVLVGVDGGEPSFDACRQAARLAAPDAAIEAAAVVHLGPVLAAYEGTPDRLQLQADRALARAAALLGARAETRSLDGFVTAALLDEIRRFDAALLAIGTHGHRRAAEILLGGPAGELLHGAPCSVLLARPADAETFPRAIVVGHDGSSDAAEALAVAQELATRYASSLRVVVALHGAVNLAPACMATAETVDRHPVAALVEAAGDADLLVVGSRGLHGLRALGSVSERVAHQAGCSVLVVRPKEVSP